MPAIPRRCINCGISHTANKEGVGALTSEGKKLLQKWIPDIEVLDTHPLCLTCFNIILSSDEGTSRTLGHRTVCINCGKSIAKARTFSKNSPRNAVAMDKARENLPDYLKGVHFEQICNACAQRFFRKVVKTSVQNDDNKNEDGNKNENEDENKETEETSSDNNTVNRIPLKEYKRVRAGRDGCVAGRGCEGALRPIPLRIRQAMLAARKLYVPPYVKLCAVHCRQPPPTTVPCVHTFSGTEVADMIFLLKRVPSFEAGADDRHWCRMWLGVSLSEFREMVERAGRQQQEEDARRAVAALLLTRHSRECHTVLASLLECEPHQVKTLAELAANCLDSANSAERSIDDFDAQAHDTEAIEAADNQDIPDVLF